MGDVWPLIFLFLKETEGKSQELKADPAHSGARKVVEGRVTGPEA